MSKTTVLKRRIGSVKNTKQITKAMELVAASKMRRAQEQAINSREYRENATEIMARLGGVSDVARHPMFIKRRIDSRLIVVVTSDIGLSGAYDGNIMKALADLLQEDRTHKIKNYVIAVGKKGSQFVARLQGVELMAAYPIFSTQPKGSDVRPIVHSIVEMYATGKVDAVTIIYTGFISSLRQEVTSLKLLPTKLEHATEVSPLEVAIFEPSIELIVESAVSRLIEVQVWQAILESLASEHSMRMMAMKNATDNATDIIDDLTLEFNTVRQAAITQEIAEIVGGAEAIAA